MECAIATFIKVISYILVPCVRIFADNSETERRLRACAEILQKQCLEWKQKYDASESEKQAVRKELAAVKTLMTGALLFYMIYHPGGTPFFAGLVIIGVVHRSTLFHLADSVNQYADSAARQIPPAMRHLVQLIERLIKQIRSGMREGRWKSVLTSRSFNTGP
jgi:hypothetical protein